MSEQEFRGSVHDAIAAAYGPEVMHDALETEEARSYIAARREADRREAEFAAAAREQAHEIAGELSAMLTEGMRFEWR